MPAAISGPEIRVEALGGVMHPGTYSLQNGSRISSLIEKAGGYADNAWLPGAVLHRKSLIIARKATIRDLVSRVEKEALSAPGDKEPKQAFFKSLTWIEPTGKLHLPLAHLRLLKGSKRDLPLEDGDSLVIPTGMPPVSVAGAVRNPGRLPFAGSGKTDFMDYIRRAGGFSEGADPDGVYLLKEDATAVELSRKWIRWNPERSRWEIAAFGRNAPRIEPGDTIFVPRKPAPGSWTRNVKSLPDILRQIAAMTDTFVEAP